MRPAARTPDSTWSSCGCAVTMVTGSASGEPIWGSLPRQKRAVLAGHDLHAVAVGIGEVKAAAATTRVDLHVPTADGSAAVWDTSGLDAVEDAIELFIADHEGVVIMCDVVAVVEIQGEHVVDANGRKMALRAVIFQAY